MGTHSTSDHSDQPRSCLFILSTYLAQSLSVEVLCTSPCDREESIQALYKKLLARGEVQGLEGEVLRYIVEKGAIKQTLLDLIIVRQLPFSCIKWPEFHAFVKALNREAVNPDIVPIHHSTITDWIHSHFTESQDVV